MNISYNTVKIGWLLLAILSLAFTGIFAVEISLARTPVLAHFFDASSFYRALCIHVVYAMILWLSSFTIFLWYYYLPHPLRKIETWALLMGYLSVLLLAILGIINKGNSFLNDYLPVIDHPLYWISIFFFFFAFLISLLCNIPFAIKKVPEGLEYQLVFLSLIVAFVMFVSVIISYISLEPASSSKLYYQRLFWMPGHIQQFLNAIILLISWFELVKRFARTKLPPFTSHFWINSANLLLFISIFPMLGGFFIDPVTPTFKLITVFTYGIGLGVPVLIYSIYFARHVQNHCLSSHVFILSLILYYLGVIISYGGMQSDTRVTAHYHGIVTAITVALMGFTYYFLKEKHLLKIKYIAIPQPYIFSAGMIIIIISLYVAGYYGAPRKTFGFEWTIKNVVTYSLNILVIGAVLSVIGGAMYVFYSMSSLLHIPSGMKKLIISTGILILLTSFDLPEEEKFLGKYIANIPVTNAYNETLFLQDLIGNKPTLLSPIYTKCPHSCSFITANLKKALEEVDLSPEDFHVITFSFDSTDSAKDLSSFTDRWKLNNAYWHVVTASSPHIQQLLASIDFKIEWDSKFQQYNHPNVVVVITPSGRISRYVYGIFPRSKDLKMALLEAKKENTSLSLYEGFLLRCFAYDPASKQFVLNRKFILMVISGGLAVSSMIILTIRSFLA